MFEAMGLKLRRRGHLRRHDVRAEFRKNLPVGSKFTGTGVKDGQNDSFFISSASLSTLKEIRLETL
jgi:hypothetical protein